MELDTTPLEDAAHKFERTIYDLEYCRNLFDESVVRFDSGDSGFVRYSALGKMRSRSITCYRQIIPEIKSPSSNELKFRLIFRACQIQPNLHPRPLW